MRVPTIPYRPTNATEEPGFDPYLIESSVQVYSLVLLFGRLRSRS